MESRGFVFALAALVAEGEPASPTVVEGEALEDSLRLIMPEATSLLIGASAAVVAVLVLVVAAARAGLGRYFFRPSAMGAAVAVELRKQPHIMVVARHSLAVVVKLLLVILLDRMVQ